MHPNLKYLLRPSSMAIVGANDRGNVGARTIENAKQLGFGGAIYPVNPKYQEIDGLICYPSLADLPERPDQVVVAIPIPAALDVVKAAAAAGVPAAVVFSEGFSDAGTPRGLDLDKALKDVARTHGMAVSGPNSMGLMSLHGHVGATFMRLPKNLKAGNISVVSQSGGLINALTELGRNRGTGFHYLLSAGNESIIDGADYLRWLADDDDTRVIISIVEGVKRGPEYREALAYATRRKPVVVLKLGATNLGQRATMAHTGSLAGSHDTFRAMCAQAGAILVDDIDSLLDVAMMLESAPEPQGDRVVIFSTSGGATVLSTDIGVGAGLHFPPLGDATNAALQDILEVSRPFGNPFDVVGNPRIVKGDNMRRCLQTLIADDGVDVIAFVLVLQRQASAQRTHLLNQISEMAAASAKPIVVIPEMTAHWDDLPPDIGTPVAGSLRGGLRALKALVDYGTYRRRVAPHRDGGDAHSDAFAPVAFPEGRSVLTEHESKSLLKDTGFSVPEGRLVEDAAAAVSAAAAIGYPVSVKVQSPDLLHKTEAGALRLNLRNGAEMLAACEELARNLRQRAPEARIDGLLVEKMVATGVEAFVGMYRDAVLGPVVIVGPGGTLVELMGDALSRRLPPFSREDAEAMIHESTALEKLLSGYRGAPPADRDALVDLVERFGRLALAAGPQVAAIDLNPVFVLPRGQGTVVVDASFEEIRPAGNPRFNS